MEPTYNKIWNENIFYAILIQIMMSFDTYYILQFLLFDYW